MTARADALEAKEPLGKWLAGSLILHLSVAGLLVAFEWIGTRNRAQFGDLNGGGIGSVAVTPVARIPLPQRSGPLNPVANDTESRVPEAPPKAKPKPLVKEPPPDAIPLKSRAAPKKPSELSSAPNRFREKQVEPENQVYSSKGQAVVSPMYGQTGAGGVSIGTNSPFGQLFGYYANLIRDKVARNWKTNDLDPRIRTAPQVIVTFTIQRDGSVPTNSVRIAQRSGNSALDYSAQRAILDASPFPQLPQGWSQSSADIEFVFELRR